MKKLLAVFTAVFAIASSGYAQYNYNAIPVMDYFRVEQMTEESLSKVLNENDIQGSPYLNNEFCTGTVYTTSKQKIVDIQLRYNIYNDDLEFKSPDGKILAIDNPENVEMADFCDYQMVYLPYLNRRNEKKAFFKVLEEGELSLYAKPDVFFQREQKGDGIRADKPAEFVEKPDILYLKISDRPAVEVGNKKDILEIIPHHKKEIRDYIRQQKIKPSSAENLKKLVHYYNSL
jgi:hypothetical protein